MLARIRKHLTYANVMATVAVFIALGGTAVGAVVISSNSQLGPGTVSGANPPTGKHSNIIKNSIGGKDIKPDSIGGPKIVESSLGKVPSAHQADSATGATNAINAINAGNAGNAGTVDGKNASDFLASDATAGGDLSGLFGDLQLGANSAGPGEIADVQRSVVIPITSLINCQDDPGAYLTFGGVDNADNHANLDLPGQDGSSPSIRFDADASQPDEDFEICTTFAIPADYASGGAFRVTGFRGLAATAEEDLTCGATVNQAFAGSGSTPLTSGNVNGTSCTPVFSQALTPGASFQFFLSVTSPTTMDSLVSLASVEFVYTATQ
jgi:hypothetical protein